MPAYNWRICPANGNQWQVALANKKKKLFAKYMPLTYLSGVVFAFTARNIKLFFPEFEHLKNSKYLRRPFLRSRSTHAFQPSSHPSRDPVPLIPLPEAWAGVY
jgi:hypothetical protein